MIRISAFFVFFMKMFLTVFFFYKNTVCQRGTEKAMTPALSGAMMPLLR